MFSMRENGILNSLEILDTSKYFLALENGPNFIHLFQKQPFAGVLQKICFVIFHIKTLAMTVFCNIRFQANKGHRRGCIPVNLHNFLRATAPDYW